MSEAEVVEHFDSFSTSNTGIYLLNPDESTDKESNRFGPLSGILAQRNTTMLTFIHGAQDTGISMYAKEISQINDHVVEVKYLLQADAAARLDSYVSTNIWRTCPAQVLTIGYESDNRATDWSSGTFYGCP